MKVKANGIALNYELDGPPGAPVVTFCHSLSTSLDLWNLQIGVLRDTYRVLRFDCRGHGLSDAPPGPYTIKMMTEDLVGLLKALEIQTTSFVGISMGGMIGQVLAIEYPEYVDKLVLCSTACRVPPESGPVWEQRIRTAETEGMAPVVEESLERWFSEEFRRASPSMIGRIRDMAMKTPVSGYCGSGRAISRFDVSNALGKITAPTLIMAGEHDPGTPVAMAETIGQKIPSSRLVIIPGALHLINVEAADIFNRKLMDFLI
ncbi:MAG: alpha/beta fold hydrolase [Syntrophobacteraceae bacterium]